MLGLDNSRGENMEQALGLTAMMDSFQRHYGGFPAPTPGFSPWPMMPGLPIQHQPHPHQIQHPQDLSQHPYPNMHNFAVATTAEESHRNSQPMQSLPSSNSVTTVKNKSRAKAAPSPPPSRERFSYTRYQLELLNLIYEKIRYPNTTQKQLIGKRVGITRDQVKIWFQNRRRKDITGKNTKQDHMTGLSQVPTDISKSVLQELLHYEKEPKSKKTTESLKEYNQKVSARKRALDDSDSHSDTSDTKRQRHLSSESSMSNTSVTKPLPLPIRSTELPEIFFPTEVTSPNGTSASDPQGCSMPNLSPHSRTTDSTSFSSDYSSYQIHSVESSAPATPYNPDDSTGSITSPAQPPLTIVPSAEQLDMQAPPNAVALPFDEATLERPRSLESPALGPYVEGAFNPSSKDIDTDIGLQLEGQAKDTTAASNVVPPNTIAPPSEKINFDIAKIRSKPKEELSVKVPSGQNSHHSFNASQNDLATTQNSMPHFASCNSLLTPSPVQLFSNTQTNQLPQAYNNVLNTSNNSTPCSPEQSYATLQAQPNNFASYGNDLSLHYEKLLAPYMVGYFPPEGVTCSPHTMPTQMHPLVPYMPNYQMPFTGYELPSDLTLKK